MTLLTINLLLAIVCLICAVGDAYRRQKVLTPEVIMFGMPFLLLLLPAWLSEASYRSDFAFNLIVTLGLIVAIGASLCKALVARHWIAAKPDDSASLPGWFVFGGASLYAAYMAGMIISLIVQYGGIVAALTVARVQELLGGGILMGRGLELVFQLPQVLYYIAIGTLVNRKRTGAAAGLCLMQAVFYVFTANTRLPMLFPFVALAIVVVERAKPTTYRAAAPTVGILAVVGVLVFSTFGNALRQGTLLDFDSSSQNFLGDVGSQIREDFGYYGWLRDVYEACLRGDVRYDHGYGWLVMGPISIVPRALWPEKPITSTSNRLTEQIIGATIGDGTPITTFTIYGEGFFQAGYVGVFLAVAMYAALYYVMLWRVGTIRNTEYWRVTILLHMMVFFRAEVPIPDMILWAAFLALFGMVIKYSRAV